MMKCIKRSNAVVWLFRLVVAMSFSGIHSVGFSQAMPPYKPHQVIPLPNGFNVEILTCRAEAESEECNVIYYTTKRQQGVRKWVATKEIVLQQSDATFTIAPKTQHQSLSQPIPDTFSLKQEAIVISPPNVISNPLLPVEPVHTKVDGIQKNAAAASAKGLYRRYQKDPSIQIRDEVTSRVSAEGKLLTLDNCYQIALAKNLALQRAQNNISLGVIDNKIAQFSRLPSVLTT